MVCVLVITITLFDPIQEDETGSELTHAVDAEAAKPQVPVVKAKASVLMNSLITSKRRETPP